MSEYTYASELFLNELLRISSNIIWKNPKKATDSEDLDNIIQVEQFNLASQGQLTFDLIYKFDEEALKSIGLSDIQAMQYSDDPMAIPYELRDICTKKQNEYILTHFEEKNNYYRMLNGLPDIDDTSYLYNTKYPMISDATTPIHLLSMNQLYSLEENGYLDELYKQYPEKEYLKHLTSKKIDIYTARNTDDYGILWMPASEYETLASDFKDMYNSCRYMITNVYQMQTVKEENTEYAGFIGLTILFMTILQMHRKFLDTDITRDFYDEDSLKYVYDSYGVPFYLGIPIEFHTKIVKNINRLLSYKGSTQVIYELFDIFEMSAMSIYEYYMLKIHKFENGKPIFVKDENGNYDYRQMYDIKFAQVQLYNNPIEEVSNFQNHVDYDDLVGADPYWITDEELLDKIYSEEYNYMDSKYLGIQTTFNLMKIVYESSYYMKMIIDNRETLGYTTIYNNSIRSNCNLFDLIIYTCALICKKYGYEGNIPTDPHQIGKVMGFDFKQDLAVLKEHISKSDYLKNDTTLIDYLDNLDINSYESVCNLYSYITELRTYLSEKMSETDNVEIYWAYYELYQSLMYSEYAENVFMKSDGKTAESFADLLKDINPILYNRLVGEMSDIEEEVSYTLYLLKSSCKKLKNIQYLDNANIDTIIEYVFKLIDFFKSAKADTTGYEIVYSLVSKMDNFIKLMNYIDIIYDKHQPVYSIIDELQDLIRICNEFQKFKGCCYQLSFEFRSEIHKYKIESMIDRLTDCIKIVSCMIKDLCDSVEMDETISNIEINMLDEDKFEFGDDVKLLYDEVMEIMKYMVKDYHEIHEVIPVISESLNLKHEEIFEMITSVIIKSKLNLLSKIYSKDNIPIINDITINYSKNYSLEYKLMSDTETRFLNLFDVNFREDVYDLIHEYLTPDQKEHYTLNTLIHQITKNIKLPENSITTKDSIKPIMYKYLMDLGMTLYTSLSNVMDTTSYISELSQYDASISESTSSVMKYSSHKMSDTLTLKYERTFE